MYNWTDFTLKEHDSDVIKYFCLMHEIHIYTLRRQMERERFIFLPVYIFSKISEMTSNVKISISLSFRDFFLLSTLNLSALLKCFIMTLHSFYMNKSTCFTFLKLKWTKLVLSQYSDQYMKKNITNHLEGFFYIQ